MTENKSYCPHCDDITEVRIAKRVEQYPIKKDTVELEAAFLGCGVCGGEFSDSTIEQENYESAVVLYRRKHGLLSPDMILAIRKDYGLTVREFASLLGWSHASLNRYENGRIQDRAHNEVLVLLQQPSNLKQILDWYRTLTTEKWVQALHRRLEEMIVVEQLDGEEAALDRMYDLCDDSYRGGRQFSASRFVQAVASVVSKSGSVFKTKLLKLLFYSDYLHFKRHRESMTGTVYAAIDHGPVPDEYERLITYLLRTKILKVRVVSFPDGNDGEEFTVDRAPDLDELSQLHLSTIDDVVAHFQDFSAKQIRDYSHGEAAWSRTDRAQMILYSHAKDLSID
jgi:putative zinc finger/helix-turn-helix YgiT family protein